MTGKTYIQQRQNEVIDYEKNVLEPRTTKKSIYIYVTSFVHICEFIATWILRFTCLFCFHIENSLITNVRKKYATSFIKIQPTTMATSNDIFPPNKWTKPAKTSMYRDWKLQNINNNKNQCFRNAVNTKNVSKKFFLNIFKKHTHNEISPKNWFRCFFIVSMLFFFVIVAPSLHIFLSVSQLFIFIAIIWIK